VKSAVEMTATSAHAPAEAARPSPRRVSVEEAYSLWAGTYDKPNPLHALEERVMQPWLPDLRGKRVVDVACGTGRWLKKAVGAKSSEAVGIDLSRQMLARAASHHGLHGRVILGDCQALPVASASADLVFFSLALAHARDLSATAAELVRITRRGAEVFVSDFHPLALEIGWRRTLCAGNEILEVPSIVRSLEEIRAAFGSAGLEEVRFAEPCFGPPEKAIFAWHGKEDLYESVRGIPALYIFQFRFSRRSP
jgi:SAM-dependent methyltransferase